MKISYFWEHNRLVSEVFHGKALEGPFHRCITPVLLLFLLVFFVQTRISDFFKIMLMVLKSCTSWYGKYPGSLPTIIYRVLFTSHMVSRISTINVVSPWPNCFGPWGRRWTLWWVDPLWDRPTTCSFPQSDGRGCIFTLPLSGLLS